MNFIKTLDGLLVPISEIVEAKEVADHENYGGEKRIRISTKHGSHHTRFTKHQFRLFYGTIIKADPGYEVLIAWEFSAHDNEFGFHRSPVVAWSFCGEDDLLIPVTVCGAVNVMETNYAILAPSGTIFEYDNAPKTFDEWKTERESEWELARKKHFARGIHAT